MEAALHSGRYSVALLVMAVLVKGIVSQVTVEEIDGELILTCKGLTDVIWNPEGPNDVGKSKNLGPMFNDPRGTYTCSEKSGTLSKKEILQVYVRMCENCIEVDPGTISGIVVADAIITVLIAVAVYCVSGSERGRSSRASDRQVLIPNDQLYQPLRDREESAYSHITASRPRRK